MTQFSKKMTLEDIGEIKYRYSKKAKYIRIVISNTSQVSVIIPNTTILMMQLILFTQKKMDSKNKN